MSRRLSGLRAWIWQRLSAAYMAGFLIWVVVSLLLCPPDDYAAWHSWVTSAGVSIATTLFFAALLLHAWVGMRDVIIDYIHAPGWRLLSLSLLGLFLLACGIWLVQILYVVSA